MAILLIVAVAGCAAALVDGTLGMGFGPTSSTILLSAGLTPAAVSATVNLAKVATGVAGGVAHWRFGNVDHRLVLQLAGPGCVGAVVGVTLLANVDGDRLRPYLAMLLFLVGIRILVRFSRRAQDVEHGPTASDPGPGGNAQAFDRRGIGVAAFVGGITNGLIGAWGPVVTPVLLHRKGLEPRIAIGSVNTAEIAVALAASGSLLASLGGAGVDAGILIAMLVGGVAAAPLAAWAVRHLSPSVLGVAAGALLLTTNVRVLAGWSGVGSGRWLAYALVLTSCGLAIRRSRRRLVRPEPVPA
jgi:uncharacterized membrane protein YfcA